MGASSFLVRLALVASSVFLSLLPSSAFARQSDTERIVVFGGSLSDTGNAFVLLSANPECGVRLSVPPYDTLDESSVPDGPYAKGGHHFTNGATWVEGLARYLALAGNTRPALASAGPKASNYAAGGARAVADYPCRFNLPDQVDTYLSDIFPHLISASTLVTIEIGGNDVRDALAAAATGGDPTQYITRALDSLSTSIVELHSNGARRFLLLNVGPIDKTPALLMLNNPAIAAVADSLTGIYNAQLESVVAALRGPEIDIKILDVHSLLNTIISDPDTYGFTNATDACVTPDKPPFQCMDPDSYVFWDGIHPTRAVHAIVAQQAILALMPK